MKIFDFSTLKFYYHHLGYKLIVQMLLSVSISVLDSLGLSMFFPILEIVSNDGKSGIEGSSSIYQYLEAFFNFIHLEINLTNVLVLLSIFFILKGAAQYIYIIYFTNVRQGFIRNLRIKLINQINDYSYEKFVSSDVGRVQNSLTGEIDRIANSYMNYFSMLQNLIFVVIYMICVFVIDLKFALLVVVGGLATNLLFSRIFKYTKREANALTKKNHSFQGFVLQYIGNYKYLKATGRIIDYSKILIQNVYGVEKNGRKIGQLGGIVTALREPSLIILVSIIIVIQISVIGGSISTILLSLVFFYRAFGYLMVMQNAYNNYLASHGSLNNIFSLLDELNTGKEEFYNELDFQSFKDKIELKNIAFSYSPESKVLDDISLTILSKESVALVGESGSGKTTLANVIAGMFRPSSGELLVDGQNIENLKIKEYREKIGYITQESVIFNDTIFNNITFWSEKTPENFQKFQSALEAASIAGFVNELSEKEDTKLGNNGINLSGGQRQRISIAREIYKNAEILILDEATSALDSETEKEVQANIDIIRGKTTLIVIAHRLSTIKNIDKIILMKKGKIIESGSFEELMEKSPVFRNMVKLQEISQ
ncbi:ABC transporter ATP-binding protein [Moheibacter sp.]|uniref:ABC transporter ATP-binding protein n=1 Tax=Moheibacter sp. TaxID=1965316 RepID=UPI003C77D10C